MGYRWDMETAFSRCGKGSRLTMDGSPAAQPLPTLFHLLGQAHQIILAKDRLPWAVFFLFHRLEKTPSLCEKYAIPYWYNILYGV